MLRIAIHKNIFMITVIESPAMSVTLSLFCFFAGSDTVFFAILFPLDTLADVAEFDMIVEVTEPL